MAKLTPEDQILEDLTVCPGTGATKSVGSDRYPYWITEVLPGRVFGICGAKSHFDKDHPWEGGAEVIEPWNPARDKTELYIKRCYGHWWKVDKTGKKRLRRFDSRWESFTLGKAESYRDPSF